MPKIIKTSGPFGRGQVEFTEEAVKALLESAVFMADAYHKAEDDRLDTEWMDDAEALSDLIGYREPSVYFKSKAAREEREMFARFNEIAS